MNAKTTLFAFLLTTPLALLAQSSDGVDKKTTQVELPQHEKPSLIKSMEPSPLPRAPTADQTTAAKLVYGLLSDSRYAYRPVALDDTLSADIYKRYLESLDGGKQFLTAQDVARFDVYKLKFDDAIKSGDLDPAYAIFATYKQRVDQRVTYARNLLKQDMFDFTGNDRYEYDREDAPWATDAAALDTLWKQSVRNDWLRLKLAGKKPDDIRKTLDKRYANMGKSIAELKGEDVFQTFLNSYANSVDPHTDYFTPKTADNFNVSMSLSLEGIGAVLQKQDDVVAIREIVPGGPAGKSNKLKPGDRVVGVGQGESGAMEDVIGWRIDDVVAKIRGAKGTKVRLDVIPAESTLDSQPQRIVLVRDKVRLEDQAAKSKVITIPAVNGAPQQRIGVIELPGFYQDFEGRRKNSADYASATRDVAKLLTKLREEKVEGVVLDLRNNGGGSLNEAIELT
jgi:carboxyl-terminal processing protease